MRIRISVTPILETRWYEYMTRFLLGGIVTAIAGVVAEQWGPELGGLFLAFPAIFCASATLIEKHEEESKESKGLHGRIRASNAAAVEAAGAAIGSIGLFAFALFVAAFLPNGSAPLLLLVGTAGWFLVSLIVWRMRKAI